MKAFKLISTIAVSSALLLASTTAFAQVKESESSDGYGYEFDDDPLAAGGFGPNDSRIRVRAGAGRSTLIKLRTEFISELLKSVENL